MTNIYLEKLAKEQEKRPGFWSTTANHAGVGTLIGGAGGAIAGAGAGHALKDFAGKALESHLGHDAKGILEEVPVRRIAAAVGAHTGAGALGLAGAGVGVLHGAYRATRNHMDKKASYNVYLEKLADFNQFSRAANKISGAPKPPGKPQFWQKDRLANQRAKPLSQGASQIKDNLAATGESLQSRLSSNAAKVSASAPKASLAGDILNRVKGFAKKNPLAVAGGLAAGGLLAHKAFSNPTQPQQQYGYQ